VKLGTSNPASASDRHSRVEATCQKRLSAAAAKRILCHRWNCYYGRVRRIFGTGEVRNFKFGIRIDLGKSHLMRDKILQKGAWSGSRGQILKFETPFCKSGMGEARNVEFGT